MSPENAGQAGRLPVAPARDKDPSWNPLRLAEPVVVLTCARSGSTLLRFILDSHPELACPPETGVVDMCTRMGVLSMLLDGPPTGVRPGLTSLASATIRSWVTTTFGTYLLRTGKTRWCDKSLGSAESANRFLDLFPKAKFICLYRNCMDVIDSVMEACPFGLRGYGLDPYAAAHPGNNVGAVADYWVFHTRMSIEFEQAHPDTCLRLRYEDLVADPEVQAGRIFAFLGEAPVPGISRSWAAADREEFGPGDHKIWGTSAITTDSVGRGSRIPAQLISPPVRALVSSLLGELGYSLLDQGGPADPAPASRSGPSPTTSSRSPGPTTSSRSPGPTTSSRSPGPTTSSRGAGQATRRGRGDDAAVLDELEELLASRLSHGRAQAGPQRAGAEAAWSPFLITATVPAAGAGLPLARWWLVDPVSASLTRGGARAPDVESDQWTVTGEAQTWRSVLTGELNIGTAIRQGHLRYSGLPRSPRGTPQALLRNPHGVLLRQLLAPPADALVTT